MWKEIKNKLDDFKEDKDITFDELLQELDVLERWYILVMRSSLNTPVIILKRGPNDLKINNYNPVCLRAWRANIEIQYVLDVYACAMCIVHLFPKPKKESVNYFVKLVLKQKKETLISSSKFVILATNF